MGKVPVIIAQTRRELFDFDCFGSMSLKILNSKETDFTVKNCIQQYVLKGTTAYNKPV